MMILLGKGDCRHVTRKCNTFGGYVWSVPGAFGDSAFGESLAFCVFIACAFGVFETYDACAFGAGGAGCPVHGE